MATTEFYIEFDLLDGHSPSTGATLNKNNLNSHGWRSIGNPNGARIVNETGKTIRAIHMKTKSNMNVFRVDTHSLGRLFDAAWFKADGSEVYFAGANIPSGDPTQNNIPERATVFWNRVPPSTRQEIHACDNCHECPFEGQVFDTNPAVPTGSEWQEIRRVLPPEGELWKALWDATPSAFRDIEIYCQHPDNNQVLFISRDEIFLYTHDSNSLKNVTGKTFANAVNSITECSGGFLLWSNGRQIRAIGPKKSAFAQSSFKG